MAPTGGHARSPYRRGPMAPARGHGLPGGCDRPAAQQGGADRRDASVDDRLLVVYRLGDTGRLRVTRRTVGQALVGPRRLLATGPYLTTRELHVETDPPLPLDLDGEVRGTTPVGITLLPDALRGLVPPGLESRSSSQG